MKRKIVVIVSGGVDSTVLLHRHVRAGDNVRALAVNYGQRHRRELLCAAMQAHLLQVPFQVADMSSLCFVLPGSSQTDRNVSVPKGHYEEESMKQTVVPNRNMILLSVAIGHAIAMGCDSVSYGAHAGDHCIYPDCREEFASAMDGLAKICDWKPIDLLRPFVKMTKAEVVTLGADLGVDFGKTYSCYEGEILHCGQCGTCVERREAFSLAHIKDPVPYDPDAPFLAELLRRE